MPKLISIAAGLCGVCGQDLFLPANNLSSTGILPVTPVSKVVGVALNGWLHLEDWFFSWDQGLPVTVPYAFDEVASGPTLPQGRMFPSNIVAAQLVDPWLSEGELTGVTASRIGDQKTIDATTVHREGYITEHDFKTMAANGIFQARLPFGWWMFDSNPVDVLEPTLISDPCYPDHRFVTVPGSFLSTMMEQAARHNVRILFDLHAMPCGSSDGTYNGIYPNDPIFFSASGIQAHGLQVVDNMMKWYLTLPPGLQRFVHGFTVLNEPAHLIVGANLRTGVTGTTDAIIVNWLKQAVDIFVEATAGGKYQPLLYMNLIQTAFPGTDGKSSLELMADAYVEMGLGGKDWAVFDVHNYFAWSGPGGRGIPAGECGTDSELTAAVQSGMQSFTSDMKAQAARCNILNLATSEWSLALHHKDHIDPCTAPSALQIMHDEQIKAFADAGMGNFFWGWRMPYGGCHQPTWSLKYHLTNLY